MNSAELISLEVERRKRRAAKASVTVETLFTEDLARSGLTIPQAKRLGFKLATTDELWQVLRPKNPERPPEFTAQGYAIPYFTPDGKRLPFVRVKKLRGKFGANDDGTQRYASPLNSLPHLYLPAPVFSWLPKSGPIRVERLVITEGEKKAAKACAVGIPCVALGGVNSYRSTKHAVMLLEEFGWFDLRDTEIEVVYDSDAYQNPDVNRALHGLSDSLRRDANPKSVRQKRLTAENAGAKVALDDFLAAHARPEAARQAYGRLAAKDDPISEAFATFNREIAHVKRKTRYFNVAHGTWYPSQKQVSEEYARGKAVLDQNGKPMYPIARWFNERPAETEVLDVRYTPGKPERFRLPEIPGDVLNTWRPGPLVPTPFKRLDQVTPFLEFVAYLTPGLTDAERDWLHDWSAYPIQNLGSKVLSAVLIWSARNGTGKNTYGRVLKAIYGPANCREVDGTTLTSNFNDWTQCQFAIVNEIRQASYNERAAVMARTKTLITEPTIDLERKFLPRENVPNHVNFYFTSNDYDALQLEEDDRRFFIVQGPDGESKWSTKQFRAFNTWLDAGGYEKVYGFLLKRSLKNFDPYAPPPRTAARSEMLAGRSSPIDDLVQVLITTPTKVLGLMNNRPPADLYLPDQLILRLRDAATERGHRLTLTVGILRAALSRHQVVKRKFEMQKNGRHLVTAYALFGAELWAKKSDAEWRAHLLEHNPEIGQR